MKKLLSQTSKETEIDEIDDAKDTDSFFVEDEEFDTSFVIGDYDEDYDESDVDSNEEDWEASLSSQIEENYQDYEKEYNEGYYDGYQKGYHTGICLMNQESLDDEENDKDACDNRYDSYAYNEGFEYGYQQGFTESKENASGSCNFDEYYGTENNIDEELDNKYYD